MIIRSFIPELNLWIHNILYNNNLTSSYVNIPVKPSDKWLCRDSVIELLFNETFDPTGNVYDDNLPFIYKYKTVNIKKLQEFDSVFYRRIQIYPHKYIWCADDPNNEAFKKIQNLVIPSFSSKDGDNYYGGINPTKYVTKYKSVIITSTNDELHMELPDGEDPEPNPESEIYGPDVNIFGLTKEELEMCQYLYYYRTGQFELICCFPCDFYYKLRSPLSKWVYLYLQCYLFNTVNYEYLNTITTEDDGVLRCMFEKHAQDRIYQYIQKQNFDIWNDVNVIGDNELRRKFVDYTMNCHSFIWTNRLSVDNIKTCKIQIKLDQDSQPMNSSNFEFIYKGKILRQNIDFEIVNEGNYKDLQICVKLKKPELFQVGVKYQLLWSALTPTTPHTRNFFNTKCCVCQN